MHPLCNALVKASQGRWAGRPPDEHQVGHGVGAKRKKTLPAGARTAPVRSSIARPPECGLIPAQRFLKPRLEGYDRLITQDRPGPYQIRKRVFEVPGPVRLVDG